MSMTSYTEDMEKLQKFTQDMGSINDVDDIPDTTDSISGDPDIEQDAQDTVDRQSWRCFDPRSYKTREDMNAAAPNLHLGDYWDHQLMTETVSNLHDLNPDIEIFSESELVDKAMAQYAEARPQLIAYTAAKTAESLYGNVVTDADLELDLDCLLDPGYDDEDEDDDFENSDAMKRFASESGPIADDDDEPYLDDDDEDGFLDDDSDYDD